MYGPREKDVKASFPSGGSGPNYSFSRAFCKASAKPQHFLRTLRSSERRFYFPTWGRAVAPVAEWVAQALWSSCSRSASNDKSVPTRLTGRRRSEGRGNRFEVRANPVPRTPKVCEVCGAEGVPNRYCRSCAVEVSRDHMANVALIGHARPKTQRAKVRISKTLSDHAVANSWWDPKVYRVG